MYLIRRDRPRGKMRPLTNKRGGRPMKKSNGQAVKKGKSKKNRQKIEPELENEIIIGLIPKRQNNKKKNTRIENITRPKKNKNNIQPKKIKESVGVDASVRPRKSKNNIQTKKPKTSKIKLKIIKWVAIIAILLTAVVLFMLSDLFNIKQIVVLNNSKISTQEILNLSTLSLGNNMFKTMNKTIRDGVKTNPYIENVKVKRDLSGVVTLEIEERTPTYILQYGNSYLYINNQGYILEMSETPLELPKITGYVTNVEAIKEGNRLEVEDLKKLEDVIKIIELSKNTTLVGKITEINIENSSNYILTIASEGKTVQFGDNKNIKVKILKIEAVLKQTEGEQGEIYFQNLERTIFKKAV